MRKVSVALAMAALVIGTTGCPPRLPPGDFYLSIASTLGGVVARPGEEWYSYYLDTRVELIAVADEHCHFVNWTGDVDTIDDVNAASTNITMKDSYHITANFELDPGCHRLTIFDNYGGSVIEPGEGHFTYVASTTIALVAKPHEDYRFNEWTGDVDTIANVNAAATIITMDDNYSITASFEWFDIVQVAAGADHTLGLKNDGTVVGLGYDALGQLELGSWTDITQVAGGGEHTVGLEANGTVLAVGWNDFGQCDVSGWTNIMQVAAGGSHTVGLKADGTVVAVGDNAYGQCDVSGWTNIIQVAAGWDHTVGLKSDGTVVATGCAKEFDDFGQCAVGSWTDIIQVVAGWFHTMGLRNDGTVIAVGYRYTDYGQFHSDNWTSITQIAAGWRHTVGLKANGTVVAVGDDLDNECDVGSWTDIIQVAAGMRHTLGLEDDGTVVAVGFCGCGECNVGGWVDTWSYH